MPINRNTFIIYDYETGSINPHTTQPIQLAAIAIDARNLEFIPNSEFNTMIKPIFDKTKQAELGIDDLEEKALEVNKKTIAELQTAPEAKVAWNNFATYCKNYGKGKDWDNPILVGFNNIGFDTIINTRLAKQYGYYDEVKQKCTLFHPSTELDVHKMMFTWFESNYDLGRLSLDTIRDFLGMSKDNAHDALQDVKDTGQIFIRLLNMQRKMAKNVKWK